MEVRQSSLVVEKSGPCFIIGDAEAAPGAGRFSDRATADAAASAATASAFAARVREPIPADPDNGGASVERKSYALSMDIVRDNTDYFEQLAARFGADYEGWEASAD